MNENNQNKFVHFTNFLQPLQQQRLLYFNSANLNATHPQNYNEVVEPLASRKRPYLLDHIGEGMNLFSKKTNRQWRRYAQIHVTQHSLQPSGYSFSKKTIGLFYICRWLCTVHQISGLYGYLFGQIETDIGNPLNLCRMDFKDGNCVFGID